MSACGAVDGSAGGEHERMIRRVIKLQDEHGSFRSESYRSRIVSFLSECEIREVSRTDVLQHLWDRRKRGEHVDERLLGDVKCKVAGFFLLTIRKQESFLTLVWHEIDKSRILTPRGQSRTLKDVTERCLSYADDFGDFVNRRVCGQDCYCPMWFSKCRSIDDAFGYDRFGWLAVVFLNGGEAKQSPRGTLYIRDGCHKALVLSKKLLDGSLQYRPVEALLLLPRPCP